jgi:hypothetical protein
MANLICNSSKIINNSSTVICSNWGKTICNSSIIICNRSIVSYNMSRVICNVVTICISVTVICKGDTMLYKSFTELHNRSMFVSIRDTHKCKVTVIFILKIVIDNSSTAVYNVRIGWCNMSKVMSSKVTVTCIAAEQLCNVITK